MNKKWGFVMFILVLTVLFYAVPKLPMYSLDPEASLFAVVWLCFALVVVAAHLYHLIGVGKEEEREYRRIVRMKRWKMEQQLLKLSRMRSSQR